MTKNVTILNGFKKKTQIRILFVKRKSVQIQKFNIIGWNTDLFFLHQILMCFFFLDFILLRSSSSMLTDLNYLLLLLRLKSTIFNFSMKLIVTRALGSVPSDFLYQTDILYELNLIVVALIH
jgi:hypothetical protein